MRLYIFAACLCTPSRPRAHIEFCSRVLRFAVLEALSQKQYCNNDAQARPRRARRRRVQRRWPRAVQFCRLARQAAVRDGDLLSEDKYAEVCDAQEREEDAAASRAYP